MHVGGQWVDKSNKIDVLSPFDGSVVDTVPKGDDASDVETAIQTAERGAKIMAGLTGYERYEILRKVADLMVERAEELAEVITREEGKILAERQQLNLLAHLKSSPSLQRKRKRMTGETIPLEGAPGGPEQTWLHGACAMWYSRWH